MTEPLRMGRRRFLYAALGAGSAVALAGLRPWRALIETSNQSLAARLGALLRHRESAREVGGEYLRAIRPGGGRNRARVIAAEIAADLPRTPRERRAPSCARWSRTPCAATSSSDAPYDSVDGSSRAPRPG